jgi:hypothetical protein
MWSIPYVLQASAIPWLGEGCAIASWPCQLDAIVWHVTLPVQAVPIRRGPLLPDLDILPHGSITTASVMDEQAVLHIKKKTHGTSAKIRSNLSICSFPSASLPSLIFGKIATGSATKASWNFAELTGVIIRHHETFTGHPAGLMNQHVASLVV